MLANILEKFFRGVPFMSQKDKLLSIGDVSKVTGAGIKALRYYERINILKPAYVDPDTSYRYYSFDQTYMVELIKLCIELDIPLKELAEYIDGESNVDYLTLLARGKDVVEKKMETLTKGLNFIKVFNQHLALQEKYPMEQVYTRKYTEKYFYVMPYEESFENVDQYEVTKLFLDTPYYEDGDGEWIEYGLLCEYSAGQVRRYAFIEAPRTGAKGKRKVIPAGQYHCRQSDTSQIEQAGAVFEDYLDDKKSFIAIETEVFSGKSNINRHINELRVIRL